MPLSKETETETENLSVNYYRNILQHKKRTSLQLTLLLFVFCLHVLGYHSFFCDCYPEDSSATVLSNILLQKFVTLICPHFINVIYSESS